MVARTGGERRGGGRAGGKWSASVDDEEIYCEDGGEGGDRECKEGGGRKEERQTNEPRGRRGERELFVPGLLTRHAAFNQSAGKA